MDGPLGGAAPRAMTTPLPHLPLRAHRRPHGTLLEWLLGAVCLLFLLCVPWVYYASDMNAWLDWARASEGVSPWRIYRVVSDCNYPPFVLYLLTLAEAARRGLHAAEVGPVSVTLVKIPSLLACAMGVPLCRRGLRGLTGPAYARAAAAAYGLSLPLWFNAAVWGQCDALLSLALTAAAVALLRDRPGWCGVALGWALSLKLQAVVIVPAVAVYWLARGRWRSAGITAWAALSAWAVLALPFLLAGARLSILGAYVGSVGFYPWCAMGAMNGWYVFEDVLGRAHGASYGSHILDAGLLWNALSYKALGLLMFGGYLLFLLAGLWRRPTRYGLVLACALSVFAFFMLPTEMHERYIVPAVALLALIAPATRSARRLFNAMSVMALIDQALQLRLNSGVGQDQVQTVITWMTQYGALDEFGALINIGLLVWATGLFWQEVAAAPAGAGDPVPTEAARRSL